MPYFPKLKVLFIHIPKCGGTSVNELLYKKSDIELYTGTLNKKRIIRKCKKLKNSKKIDIKTKVLQHYTIKEISKYDIDYKYSFAFVRNPYTRVISMWKYQNKNKKWFNSSTYTVYKDVNEFIKNLYNDYTNNELLNVRHNCPQSYFIYDGDKLLVDKIYHLESTTHLFGDKLGRFNSIKTPEIKLTQKSYDYIKEIYYNDFINLGYSTNPKFMYNKSECSCNYKFSIFQYWGQGLNNIPSFLKIIYNHNLEICKKHNINLVFLDDNNIYNYITPHPRFKNLAYNFKSDIIRYYILHKYGGFWFDTDVIITKNLNYLYRSIHEYECMLDTVYSNKIGCASLYIKKNSTVSQFCLNYINNVLNNRNNLRWGDIGPYTVRNLYKKHSSLILLNDIKTVNNGCNFISWKENPGYRKQNWLLSDNTLAELKADKLKNNNKCFYLITWTIYRKHNMGDNLNDMVFNDKRSVFSYFVDYK